MYNFDVFWETLKKLGISKYQLVEELGFDEGLIYRLNNNRNVTLDTITEICNKLKITPDQVYTYTYKKVEDGKDIDSLKKKENLL